MGTYTLSQKLNVGAVVETHLGAQPALGKGVFARRLVAAAQAQPFLEGFTVVADAWRNSFSSGISSLLDFGTMRDTVWVVEEHLEGASLRATLAALAARGAQLKPNEGITVLKRVLSTLVEMHAQGLVHGDVCASTVHLLPSGEVKLTEVGIARSAPLTPQGPARSERECLSPEQADGRHDTSTDVFRIGLLLYELSVGRALFAGADPLAAARAYQSPGSISSVPPPFMSLIVRLLGRDPSQRPNASEAMKALDQLLRSFSFSSTQADVAGLFSRAFPDFTPRGSGLMQAVATQMLVLGDSSATTPPATPPPAEPLPGMNVTMSPPISSAPPPPISMPMPLGAGPVSASGRYIALRADAPLAVSPVRHGMPQAIPLAVPPMLAPPGAPIPPPTPSGPTAEGAVSLARIATRKVSKGELDAMRAIEAEREAREQAKVAAAAPPRPHGPRDSHLGDHLVNTGKLKAEDSAKALAFANEQGVFFVDALIALELMEEDVVVATMSDVTKTTSIAVRRLDGMQVPAEVMKLVPVADAIALCVMPLSQKGSNQLMVAMRDPMDESVIGALKHMTRLSSIVGVRSSERSIRRTIARCYETGDAELPNWLEKGGTGVAAMSSPSAARRFSARAVELGDDSGPFEFDTSAPPRPSTPPQLAPRGGSSSSSSSISGKRAPVSMASASSSMIDLEAGGGEQVGFTTLAISGPAQQLFQNALALQGERGSAGAELLATVAAVARRVNLSVVDAARANFAASAVVIANLGSGKPAHQAPTSVILSGLLGSDWPAILPLVSPLLEGGVAPVEDLTTAVVSGTCLVMNQAQGTRPDPNQLSTAIRALRGRQSLPAPVLDALLAELMG